MIRKSSPLPLLACLLLTTTLPAETGVLMRISRGEITVGDSVKISMTVTLPSEAEPEELPGGMILQAFEIKDYDLGRWETRGKERVRTLSFDVSTFTTGTYFTSPWEVRYTLGGEMQSIPVAAVPLVVRSVLEGEEEEPVDIKPPLAPPAGPLSPWIWAVMVGLGVIFSVAWWFIRRKGGGGASVDTPPRPPDEVALEALEELRSRAYAGRGKEKRHYVELTEIYKYYLEGRYGVDALDKTSREMLELMRGLSIDRGWKIRLGEFLNFSDLVKFARYPCGEEKAAQDLELIRRFVESTGRKSEGDDEIP